MRNLDPAVLTPWARGGADDDAFREVTQGYDSEEIRNIKCPILFIQANMDKGGIFADDEVEYVRRHISCAKHLYMPEYGHNLGCYSWEIGEILKVLHTFLEAHGASV